MPLPMTGEQEYAPAPATDTAAGIPAGSAAAVLVGSNGC